LGAGFAASLVAAGFASGVAWGLPSQPKRPTAPSATSTVKTFFMGLLLK
jgi:hypothetical protein